MPHHTVKTLEEKLLYQQRLVQLMYRIDMVTNLDELFALHTEILDLLDAERLSIFVLDDHGNEMYTMFPEIDPIKKIRLPVSKSSIAGYVAMSRKVVNLSNAYDKGEVERLCPGVAFDSSWDQKTGFQTAQLLTVPIIFDGKKLLGVLQLLNKNNGNSFTADDEANITRIAETFGIALHTKLLFAKKHPTKFEYLLSHNRVTPEELNSAIAEARKRSLDIESVLMDQYKVSKSDIGASLSEFYNCPFLEFNRQVIPPPNLIKKFNLAYLKKNCWVPLWYEGDALLVLVDDLHKSKIIREFLQPYLRNREIRFAVGLRKDILLYISVASGELVSPEGSFTSLLESLEAENLPYKDDKSSVTEVNEHDSTIIRLVNQIIADSYKRGASDIHIEMYGPSKNTAIRFRIDGSCVEYQQIPPASRRAVVARLKIMARMNIAEQRKPQDGKITFALPDRVIELRVATIPIAGGNEDVVMRLLAANKPIPIDQLGLSEKNLQTIKTLSQKPYGLILVVGPTGSGKTTTLHSVLGHVNTPDKKIWTAEDPVEITQHGLRQVQVQPKIGFTFAEALRAFLRADPDVIMVGEMRDAETASIGIEASLTGHLVFSTLHTNRAVETVVRLLDMGMDPFNFADALLGVLAQRLVKQFCKECKALYHPLREEYDDLARTYGAEEFEKLGIEYNEAFVLYRGKGCTACSQTGFRGRAGIHEIFVVSPEIQRLIQTRAPVSELLKQALKEGMVTLAQDGIRKVLAGVTSLQQVKTVAIK